MSIGKYLTNLGVIGALMGALGTAKQAQAMPKDWRRYLVWIVWAAGLALALASVAKQADDEQYEAELDNRIVNEIVDELDTEQLRELTRFKDNGDDAGLQRWLIENVPDLDKIVEEEMAILLGEIAENSELFT